MKLVELDLDKCEMRMDGQRYFFEQNTSDYDFEIDSDDDSKRYIWHRENKKYIAGANGEKVPIEVPADGLEDTWSYARVRVNNVEKNRKLTQTLERAKVAIETQKAEAAERKERRRIEAWAKHNPQEKTPKRDEILIRKVASSEDSESDRGLVDWEVTHRKGRSVHKNGKSLRLRWWRIDGDPEKIKHRGLLRFLRSEVKNHEKELRRQRTRKQEREPAEDEDKRESPGDQSGTLKPRTKWGMTIFSNDQKHFFTIGMWKSRKYPGCCSVRISVAGRTCMYTLDETQMEALKQEISRGERA